MEQGDSKRDLIVSISVSILPYQKRRLESLSEKTGRTKSELIREALTYLFGAYKTMGL